ncbi:hypothetical protein G9A89_007570 [Geosiphon pyriformis]|nr:hypothetical protein G9A89_007570 [Geosiphon pyriformis]
MVWSSIAGWGAFGFGVRVFALCLEGRPPFGNMKTHMGHVIVFGAIGYYLHGVEERQMAVIKRRREELMQRRERRKEIEVRRAAYIKEHGIQEWGPQSGWGT